jgi:GMP synthase PP-ATPase subunit
MNINKRVIAAMIADALSGEAEVEVIDLSRQLEGKAQSKAVDAAIAVMENHIEAADDFIGHLPGCKNCSKDTKVIDLVQKEKAAAVAAVEAIRAFIVANKNLGEYLGGKY